MKEDEVKEVKEVDVNQGGIPNVLLLEKSSEKL